MLDRTELRPGDSDYATAMEIVGLLDEATADFRSRWKDPAEARAIIAAAGMVFAGIQAGVLMSAGEIDQGKLVAMTQTALRNFREGIAAGQLTVRQGKETEQ